MNERESEARLATQSESRNPRCAGRWQSRAVRGGRLTCEDSMGTSGEEGGALVEMAMVFPMLMLIVTAVFAFGIGLNNYLQLTDAVSTGARLLAISRGQTTDPCATLVTAVENAAPLLKPSGLSFSYVLNGTSYSGTSCSSTSTTTGAAGNLVQGAAAQITVTYPCNLAVYGRNYAPTCTLAAQTTELVQ